MAFNLWRTIIAREQLRADREHGAANKSIARMSLATDVSGQKHWILERNSILLLLGILIVIAIGGLVEDRAAVLSEQHDRERAGHAALYAARARRARHLRSRGLLSLPLADDPRRCATRSSATAITRSPPRACTTIRSSGARSAPDRTSRASAASIPTTGIAIICRIRARWCPPRSCRPIPGCSRPTSISATSPRR